MEINIFTEGNISFPFEGLEEKDFKLHLLKICKHLEIKNTSITLIFTDNQYIQKINSEYRKKDNPTDVISFSYRYPPFPDIGLEHEILGDIYLSLEMASQHARDYIVEFEDEVKRLLVHGVLHLIGYDHEQSKKDEQQMREKEDETLGVI